MNCDICRARERCVLYVQPGSFMCALYRLQQSLEGEGQPQPKPTFCPYCGKPLKIIGTEQFCTNMECANRYQPMGR